MRANLARHGRRLLVCHARTALAPSCAVHATPARRRPLTRPVVCRRFERTFFNLLQKAPREIRQPEYEPGWMQIMVWRSRILDNLRPPPRKDMMEAWKKFIQFKLRMRRPLNSTQALQCLRLFEYLMEPPATAAEGKQFSAADLSNVRQVLLEIEPYERSKSHLELAEAVYTAYFALKLNTAQRVGQIQWAFLVKSMASFGGSLDALEEVRAKWDDPEYSPYLRKEDSLLEDIARGLAREGREEELVALVDEAEKRGFSYDAGLQAILVDFFANQDKVPETQYWFTKPTGANFSRVGVYRVIASLAVRHNLQDWAIAQFLELGQLQPGKKYWDALLQAILLLGRGVAEVETMMSHMVSRTKELTPDVHTINGLLRIAATNKDVALKEEIMALSATRGIALNGETCLITLELYLETENLVAAAEAYKQVKHLEPWTNENKPELYEEYRLLMNKYLITLCSQPRPDFALIKSLIEAVEEEQLRLEPATVGALCLRFLENDQHFDVTDILAAYAFLYSETEREIVQDIFISFCHDPNTSTNRAWAAYQLLQQFFQDTSFERRDGLIDMFFNRKRPDMACEVFGHMRAHQSKFCQPTVETYIKCFEGFAKYPDLEGLEMVHNMLKMDTRIQPSTQLYTALMLAYTGCDRPLIAWDFWNEITRSQDGPSYASLTAVFWSLERRTNGHKQAKDLWAKIEQMDLDIPPSVYNAYIGTIAGSSNEKEVKALIMRMATVVGTEPDALTLGIAYNAFPGQELQSGFQEWASKRYRHVWADLLKVGRRMNEFSLCQFKIDRGMKSS